MTLKYYEFSLMNFESKIYEMEECTTTKEVFQELVNTKDLEVLSLFFRRHNCIASCDFKKAIFNSIDFGNQLIQEIVKDSDESVSSEFRYNNFHNMMKMFIDFRDKVIKRIFLKVVDNNPHNIMKMLIENGLFTKFDFRVIGENKEKISEMKNSFSTITVDPQYQRNLEILKDVREKIIISDLAADVRKLERELDQLIDDNHITSVNTNDIDYDEEFVKELHDEQISSLLLRYLPRNPSDNDSDDEKFDLVDLEELKTEIDNCQLPSFDEKTDDTEKDDPDFDYMELIALGDCGKVE
jgi:hypothetical protein